MLVENQKVEIRWNKRNKKHYIDKGYIFTEYNKIFVVRVEDLQPGSDIAVQVICDYCGKKYNIAWYHYVEVYNKKQKNACTQCRHAKRYEGDLMKRQADLYAKALKVCQSKGYILITPKEEIENNTSYVAYFCPIHGEQKMRINNLISGKGCPECAIDYRRGLYQLSPDEVEERIRDCGGILLNKNDYINRHMRNLLIQCPECGAPFLTSLVLFTQHGGQVCESCFNTESIGEKRIRHYLENHDIVFNQEKWFPDCRDINPLPFDFYLPELNTICEFDGRQHYGETGYFTYSFEETQRHDRLKEQYCIDNNIKLIRIPYWHINNIEKILDKELVLHEDIV